MSFQLPVKIDIIKHNKETEGKSTSTHAAILADGDVHIYTYPNIPDYRESGDDTVLIFPSPQSVTVDQLFGQHSQEFRLNTDNLPKGHNVGTLLTVLLQRVEVEDTSPIQIRSVYNLGNLPIKRAVFIDSTWSQSRSIYKDERLCSLRAVVLQNRMSQFWRHQKGSPPWYLATIEAIHQFLLEVHFNAFGLHRDYKGIQDLKLNLELIPAGMLFTQPIGMDANDMIGPYCGQYDNLLFFFKYFYSLIHKHYEHDVLKAHRRPFR